MNRRRFLKYAGATAAVVGASALGLDYLGSPPPRIPNALSSMTESLTSSSNVTSSSSSKTFTLEGRLFFDKGTSNFGTAGNGTQDDTDSEPGIKDAKVVLRDMDSNVVGTTTTDSSGDFKFDLPLGTYGMYPAADNFSYMCRSVDEFRKLSDGYQVDIGDNNSKMYVGLMQGFLSFPRRGIDLRHGGYYDRDPAKGYLLAWNGRTDESEDNNPGTHFLGDYGEIIPAFAPGIVTAVYPNLRENWVFISTATSPRFDVALAHNSEVLVTVGQRISRHQPVAKAGNKGTNATVVHLQFTKVDNDTVMFLDPYLPLFPISQYYSGCWAGKVRGTNFHWQSLPMDQNPNWENYWIVNDQTHF